MINWEARAKKAEAELSLITRMIKADDRFIESLPKSVEVMLDKLEINTRCW